MTDTTDDGAVAPAGTAALVPADAATGTDAPAETGATTLARLGEEVAARLAEDFRANGRQVVESLREQDPKAYCALLARLLPEPERREGLLMVKTIMLIGRP